MRLPTDATLLHGEGAAPALLEVWREERLPTRALPCPSDEMEALPTATIVACGEGAREAAETATRLGFRVFLVGEGPTSDGVQAVGLSEATEAGRAARSRERWRAARARSPS